MKKKSRLAILVLVGGLALSACIADAPPAGGDVHALINQYFGGEAPTAECIAQHESGFNPNAVNGQYRGIFQLGSNYNGSIAATGSGNVFDPEVNVAVAKQIRDARGNWSAWSTARSCGVS